MRPLDVERRFKVPIARDAVRIIAQTRSLRDLEIDWWQSINGRENRCILRDRGRAKRICNHDGFTAAVEAGSIERRQVVCRLHLCRRISAWRQMPDSAGNV